MEYLGTDKPVNKIQPVVSVCIQTYQHAAFIAECLDSVLMQETDFPYEIIVGEDDSKDGTREICKEYAEKYPDKIRLFLRDEKDKIFINGRKTGRFNFIENLKAARGEFIALCDGDDYWIDESKLRQQQELIVSNKLVACYSNHYIKTTASLSLNNPFNNQYKEHKLIELSPKTVGSSRLLIGQLSTLVAKSIFIKEFIGNSLAKEIWAADGLLFLLLSSYGRVGYLNAAFSLYRIEGQGVTSIAKTKLFYINRSREYDLLRQGFPKYKSSLRYLSNSCLYNSEKTEKSSLCRRVKLFFNFLLYGYFNLALKLARF